MVNLLRDERNRVKRKRVAYRIKQGSATRMYITRRCRFLSMSLMCHGNFHLLDVLISDSNILQHSCAMLHVPAMLCHVKHRGRNKLFRPPALRGGRNPGAGSMMQLPSSLCFHSTRKASHAYKASLQAAWEETARHCPRNLCCGPFRGLGYESSWDTILAAALAVALPCRNRTTSGQCLHGWLLIQLYVCYGRASTCWQPAHAGRHALREGSF